MADSDIYDDGELNDTPTRLICGLDEVGRGPLAGPIVAAAVVFSEDVDIVAQFPKLKFGDSKTLSVHQREAVLPVIHEFAQVVKIEQIGVEEINANGIGWANRTLFERLIADIEADLYVVDGRMKLSNLGRKAKRVTVVVDADAIEQTVSAASIVAKVARDKMMRELHEQYPMYGWDHNAGYGTRQHLEAIATHGSTEHHRRKFVATALSKRLPKLPGLNE